MDKRQKNILVWVLTWASLLLLVLYSPFGSPDLYNNQKFYIANQGVAFNGSPLSTYGSKTLSLNNVDIKNNSKKYVNNYNGTAANSLSATITANSAKKMTINNAGASSSINSGGSANISFVSNTPTNNSTNNSGAGFGGDLYSYGSKNSKNKNNSGNSPELTSLSTNLGMLPSITSDNTTKQGGTTSLAGTTDPGGDPFGDPIPIGDGWIFLLCLAGTYAVWKFILHRKA